MASISHVMRVAQSFLTHYYTTMSKAPDQLPFIYGENSMLTLGEDDKIPQVCVVGRQVTFFHTIKMMSTLSPNISFLTWKKRWFFSS